jgi:hypothetical protein
MSGGARPDPRLAAFAGGVWRRLARRFVDRFATQEAVPVTRSRRKLSAVLLGVPFTLVALSTVALAAGPAQGGAYAGALQPVTRGIAVSFKVSKSGKQVSSLQISDIPIYCSGGGPAIPIHFKNATISGKGTFTSSAKYVIKIGPFKGQVGETFKITGRFFKGRSEQGTVATTYPKAKQCSGKSPYTTKA